MSLIRIIPIQFAQVEILEQMVLPLATRFRTEVVLNTRPPLDMAPYFDPIRSQYNANEIIRSLTLQTPGRDDKMIGVTDLDLFIPVLSYIFGQAYLGGSAALVSGYRLQNSRYGLADDQQLYVTRLLKCMVHELGHACGLIHCSHPGCVMLATTYVEEIDQKGDHFCSVCHSNLVRQVP